MENTRIEKLRQELAELREGKSTYERLVANKEKEIATALLGEASYKYGDVFINADGRVIMLVSAGFLLANDLIGYSYTYMHASAGRGLTHNETRYITEQDDLDGYAKIGNAKDNISNEVLVFSGEYENPTVCGTRISVEQPF